MKRLFLLLCCLFLPSMLACVAPNVRMLPVPDGCARWNDLPLTVALDESADVYRDQLNHAMKSWDRALKRPTFVWSYVEGVPTDVLVAAGPMVRTLRGWHQGTCYGGQVTALIYLDENQDTIAATAFATHEFGHALGLGHSTNEQSIMHATIDASLMGDWDEDHPPAIYRILPSDAQLALALHPTRQPNRPPEGAL